jgi:hypothetical protein
MTSPNHQKPHIFHAPTVPYGIVDLEPVVVTVSNLFAILMPMRH